MNTAVAIRTRHLLPALPYDHAALEPHIDTRTMMLHHGKHHAAYVEKLNAALDEYPQLQEQTALWLLLNPGRIAPAVRKTVLNNAGGHVNHGMLWRAMAPGAGGEPAGALADAIRRDFGGLDELKTRFDAAGETLFGSGWVWLARSQLDGGRLAVLTTSGHANPMMDGHFPLLLNDVWEHAYYLKHENRRSGYLKGWWAVVNWAEAARRFEVSDLSTERRQEAEGGMLAAAAAKV